MKHRKALLTTVLILCVLRAFNVAQAFDSTGTVKVYFSPHGGCTDAVVHEIEAAEQSNAENLLVIKDDVPLTNRYIENFREHQGHSERYTGR